MHAFYNHLVAFIGLGFLTACGTQNSEGGLYDDSSPCTVSEGFLTTDGNTGSDFFQWRFFPVRVDTPYTFVVENLPDKNSFQFCFKSEVDGDKYHNVTIENHPRNYIFDACTNNRSQCEGANARTYKCSPLLYRGTFRDPYADQPYEDSVRDTMNIALWTHPVATDDFRGSFRPCWWAVAGKKISISVGPDQVKGFWDR